MILRKSIAVIIGLLIIFVLFNCGKEEELRQSWYLEGTVYCDGVPTPGIDVMWGYGKFLQTQKEIDWTDFYIKTDSTGMYHAEHKTSVSSFNILNYHVAAKNPYTGAWTDPEQRRNIILGNKTVTENFYFTSQ